MNPCKHNSSLPRHFRHPNSTNCSRISFEDYASRSSDLWTNVRNNSTGQVVYFFAQFRQAISGYHIVWFGVVVLKSFRLAKTETRRILCRWFNGAAHAGVSHGQILFACITLISCTGLTGCEGKGVTEAHPVVGPPPPRQTLDVDEAYYAQREERIPAEPGHQFGGKVKAIPVSYKSDSTLDHELTGSQVVATVNGQPVFADDVLEGLGPRLAAAEKQLPPEKFRQAKKELVRRSLPDYLDRTIVLQTVKQTLAPEQLEAIEAQLDEGFLKYTDHLAEQFEVTSAMEVDEKLRKEGASLSRLRKMFGAQQIARQFLESRVQVKEEFGRSDLLAYYNKHIKDYSSPAEVKWQQIVVRFSKHSNKEAAKDVMRKAWLAIRKGAPFEDVARKFSDGVSAQDGGRWGWIQKGSLADTEIENTLFEMKEGEVSDLFTRDDRFEIVRVETRRDASRKSFAEVQVEIEKTLMADAQKRAREDFIQELRDNARVVTIFDPASKPVKKKNKILRVNHSQ